MLGNLRRLWLRERMRVGRNTTLLGLVMVAILLGLVYLFGKNDPEYVLSGLPSRSRLQRAVEFSDRDFVVMDEKKKILSGSMHYFRVPPAYWEDRMMKLKAMGLNTLETYVAWNVHEPLPGVFDFSGMLDIGRYIRLAQRIGLNVIVRPGPYICAEWENGGLPAWLLHDHNMVLRSTYPPYLEAIDKYYTEIFKILTPLQAAYGGPIIAFQLENELSHYQDNISISTAQVYVKHLSDLMKALGVVELLFTSDGPHTLEEFTAVVNPPDVFMTVNFQRHPKEGLQTLQEVQPNKPKMVMEFWTGWFDHWGEGHLEMRSQNAEETVERVKAILEAGSSINLYMFHGGTNFGFMNGANMISSDTVYRPTITSYDYDAPLNEAGDTTIKYFALRKLFQELAPESIPNPLPQVPPNVTKAAYGEIKFSLFLKMEQMLQYLPPPQTDEVPLPMEYLSVNKKNGQAYGYVLYRTKIHGAASRHKISIVELQDNGVALVNFVPVQQLSRFHSQSFSISNPDSLNTLVLDILVENSGRVNYGSRLGSRKGILGGVLVDGKEPTEWTIYSLEFKHNFVDQIQSGGLWSRTPTPSAVGPSLYKTDFNIREQPHDTFADMKGWGRGVLFVNGVNVGRYWDIGPQRTLYIPAPILRKGINKLMVFEMHRPNPIYTVTFRDSPILDQQK